MPETPRRGRYKAFLSYSHRDRPEADRLHRRLERFEIDPKLVGRITNLGPIPANLRPIFRDSTDFATGNNLTNLLRAALDESEALIVLGSPAAAASYSVNEEVRTFKQRHPDRPIIPLIVAGPPNASPDSMFPPALRFCVDGSGNVSNTAAAFFAVDERATGDGPNLAFAKVVAGLLGVPLDEIIQRAERDRRRRARLWVATWLSALSLGAAVSGAGAFVARYFQATSETETLEARIQKLTGSLNTSSKLVSAIEKEISQREALVQKLQHDADEAKKLSTLNSDQVAAVTQALRGELQNESKSNFWTTALTNLLFAAVGAGIGEGFRLIWRWRLRRSRLQ